MRRERAGTRVRGFSLVEVMVAVIVICVGLLGIAKMQALALSNTTTSRLRALAAIEAAGLASAMHSNRQYWAGNAPPATITVNGAVNPPQITSTDAALQAAAIADVAQGPVTDNITLPCVGTANGVSTCSNPVNLAAFDLARWTSSLSSLLPNPQSTITCSFVPGAPPSCTIQIRWFERAAAMTQQEAQQEVNNPLAAQIEQPTYLVYVEP
jgi:type IV pilus assembly protein PilV